MCGHFGYNIDMHILMTHEQADFDAIGALLGAALLHDHAAAVLPRRTNRNVRSFLTLYGAELPFIEARDLPAEPIETVTLVDTQSLITLRGAGKHTRVQIIDHHQVRPDLPPHWVVTTDRVGACTTLLVENLRDHNGALTTLQATLLLLGIYEDTGSLTYASTTPRDVRAAAFLLEQGASLRIAATYLNPPLSPEQRQVYDRLLASAETITLHGQKVILAFTEAEEASEEISSVAHKLRDLLDPDALLLLVKTIEGIRLVARSTTDRINVATLAAAMGGGGHERAAAALIHPEKLASEYPDQSPLEAARCKVKKLLPEIVHPSVTVKQIMSRRPTLLKPDTSAQDAALMMQRYGYEGYPVVQDGRVIGLLTRRAVDRALTHKLNLPASSLMDAGEIIIHPQDTLSALQSVMTESGWGQVPVVDPVSGAIVGIVTRTDLLKTLSDGESRLPGKINLAERLASVMPPARLGLLRLVAAVAHEQHMAVYIVGGFVRDLMLERPSYDFDIVVEGDAITLGRGLAQKYGGRVVTHSRFGTAKWWIGAVAKDLVSQLPETGKLNAADLPESLDLISARTEFYDYPTALPTVERSSIKLDLHRRDFTFNTLALRLDGRHYGDLYDYWGGLNDLHRGQVRVLHSLSFIDDPTRMLRAVRFEQRFGFQIEARTLQLMEEARGMLRQVTGERLRHEIDLIFSEEYPARALLRLEELGLLSAIHPALNWDGSRKSDLEIALHAPIEPVWGLNGSFGGHLNLRSGLAYIAWWIGLSDETCSLLTNRFRLSSAFFQALLAANALKKDLASLVGQLPSRVAARLDGIPAAALYSVFRSSTREEERDLVRRYVNEWRDLEPGINGDVLVERGLPPGPHYRSILTALRAAWLDGIIHNSEEEEAFYQQLLKTTPIIER